MLEGSRTSSQRPGLWLTIQRFIRDEEGATSIEYAMIASVVSVGILAGYLALGDSQVKIFEKWTTAVKGTME